MKQKELPSGSSKREQREKEIEMSSSGKLKSSSSELDLDGPNIEDYIPSGSTIQQQPHGKLRLRDLIDISPTLSEAAGAIVDDSFIRCFKSNPPKPWNWNVYLFTLWCLGVVVRYLILFPARVLVLTMGWIIFFSSFIPVHYLLKGHNKLRTKIERCLVEMMCVFFVASWTGVVKYHGPRPSIRPKQPALWMLILQVALWWRTTPLAYQPPKLHE